MEHSVRVTIDAFELLKAIGSNPRAFADVQAAASKAALAVVVAQLKAKDLTLEKLRELFTAIKGGPFALVLESMDAKTVASLLGKVDKHNPERATAGVTWARSHVCALGNGSAGATPPPPPKQKAASKVRAGGGRTSKSPSPAAESFWPESMQVKPRRKQKGAV
jgi:hypothetical protein